MLAAGLLLAVLSTTAPAAPSESVRWAQVRVGFSREQVTGLLGQPLLRNAARGYERWIYDGGCEVQFTGGGVSGWTAPQRPLPTPASTARVAPASTGRGATAATPASSPSPRPS
jgi:hypothetical protein